MKKFITILSLLTLAPFAMGQFTFTDDFESYSPGDYIGLNSPTWTTWSGVEGGSEDVQVTSTMAHGGSNSVYFSSTTNPGGPIDCVLPFGAQWTTGTYVLDWWMYVNSGTGAYFNFQQNTTIGQVWNSEWNFNSDGTLDVTNTTGTSFSSNYPTAQWFHLVITVNLNNAEWNVNINGSNMGTFHNTSLGIASIDIFPLQGQQFYIDDVSVSYTPASALTNDLAVCYLSNSPGLLGSTVSMKAVLRNIGSTTINNPYLSLYHNGVLVGNETFTGLNLASMDTQLVTLTNTITLGATNDISLDGQISAAMVDDDDTNDDTIYYSYTPVTPAANKLVVGEEATGTWCQWCPRGAVFMGQMESYYGPYWQGIAVHNSDPMTNAVHDAGLGGLIGGYPSALVDRLPENAFTQFSQFEADFITRVQIAPKATIVNGAMWNTGMDTLYVSLTTTFEQAVSSGNHKVALVIVENNVTGTGSGYNQVNVYSGGGQGPMGGYESLPNPVPASIMVYDFVSRVIEPSFSGWSNAYTLPASIGYTKTHNFFIPFNSSWDVNEIEIVGLFIDNTGKIDNASSSDIATAISNGFVTGSSTAGIEDLLIDELGIFPNPTTESANLRIKLNQATDVTLNIYAADGKLVSSNFMGNLAGVQNLTINTSMFADGIYMVNVLAGSTSKTLKLSVQH